MVMSARPDQPTGDEASTDSSPSGEMAKADVANGERPEQPESDGHSAYERERTDHDPAGEGRSRSRESDQTSE
jgi:hypothetical protein